MIFTGVLINPYGYFTFKVKIRTTLHCSLFSKSTHANTYRRTYKSKVGFTSVLVSGENKHIN